MCFVFPADIRSPLASFLFRVVSVAGEFNLLNWCNGKVVLRRYTRADTSLEDYPILLREIVRSGPWDRETLGIEKQAESEAICQGEVKRGVYIGSLARRARTRSAEKIISRCIFHIVGICRIHGRDRGNEKGKALPSTWGRAA